MAAVSSIAAVAAMLAAIAAMLAAVAAAIAAIAAMLAAVAAPIAAVAKVRTTTSACYARHKRSVEGLGVLFSGPVHPV